MACSFCEQLKSCKEIEKSNNRPGYKTKYEAALVQETYYKRNIVGSLKLCGYKLNFCPECGVNLEEVESK